jgi:hypothetical protein
MITYYECRNQWRRERDQGRRYDNNYMRRHDWMKNLIDINSNDNGISWNHQWQGITAMKIGSCNEYGLNTMNENLIVKV